MAKSDAASKVAGYFESLGRRVSTPGQPWPDRDRIIWLVVSVRCEIDMSSFTGLFNELLPLDDVLFLANALEKLGEPELAGAFASAHRILVDVKFDDSPKQTADLPEYIQQQLRDLGSKVTKHGGLWRLDGKLAELIPKD